jgi:hypothetical protein
MTHRTRSIIAASTAWLLVPGVALAQTFIQKVQGGATAAATPAGLVQAGGPSLQEMIGTVIGTALTFVGAILFIIMIYAGFLYMTAGGDKEKVIKAKQWITNSIIGLVIIASAYAIVTFIFKSLSTSTTGGAGGV